MKKITLLLLSVLAFANANAQKLPGKQETSVRIPANVKIDGKATEWNNKFQADNGTADLLYTIANNDEELYLVVQVKNRYVFKKIIDRGLTFSVKNAESGKIASFTFPYNVVKGTERLSLSFIGDMLLTPAKLSDDELAYNNKVLRDSHKFIKVTGVEGVDSLVSLYNENGIKAAELFDNKRIYTLEMTLNLKLLGPSTTNGTKVLYGLKVNPVERGPISTTMGMMIIGKGGRDVTAEASPELKAQAEMAANELQANMFGGTEFEGEYALAK